MLDMRLLKGDVFFSLGDVELLKPYAARPRHRVIATHTC
jgi:hypothetical protein